MAVSLIFSAALLAAQAAAVAIPERETLDAANAAYEELSTGRTDDALVRLEAALKENPGDPALLINLGTAYARLGRTEEARDAFRAAIAAEDRYQLQLADGSWEDSRRVARIALNSLNETALAAK